MRIFNIKSIDFENDLGSIDFSIYQVPFTLIFDGNEFGNMDDDEITEEICARIRLLFGYNDVGWLDYEEIKSHKQLSRLTKDSDDMKILNRKRKLDKIIYSIKKQKMEL